MHFFWIVCPQEQNCCHFQPFKQFKLAITVHVETIDQVAHLVVSWSLRHFTKGTSIKDKLGCIRREMERLEAERFLAQAPGLTIPHMVSPCFTSAVSMAPEPSVSIALKAANRIQHYSKAENACRWTNGLAGARGMLLIAISQHGLARASIYTCPSTVQQLMRENVYQTVNWANLAGILCPYLHANAFFPFSTARSQAAPLACSPLTISEFSLLRGRKVLSQIFVFHGHWIGAGWFWVEPLGVRSSVADDSGALFRSRAQNISIRELPWRESPPRSALNLSSSWPCKQSPVPSIASYSI